MNEQQDYFKSLSETYAGRRRAAIEMLEGAGFRCYVPGGAYYVMTDISGFGAKDDVSFARELVERYGVAGVPGSSFYFDKSVRVQHKFASVFARIMRLWR